MPSAYRPNAHQPILNQDALDRWIRTAAPVVPAWPQTSIEWLALAQHHGVHTSLLDWSLNPLVALYFATENNSDNPDREDKDGSVWMLDTTECDQFTLTMTVEHFREDRTKPAFLPVLGANLRAKAQFGAMTLHSRPADSEGVTFKDGSVYKVGTVQANEKGAVRRALGVLGFTKRTVYADLTAAADEFRDRFVVKHSG